VQDGKQPIRVDVLLKCKSVRAFLAITDDILTPEQGTSQKEDPVPCPPKDKGEMMV
jgi:hypothetical protein